MTEKLEPCPFCGNQPIVYAGDLQIHMVLCDKCGATVSFQGNEERDKTITRWNRRDDHE